MRISHVMGLGSMLVLAFLLLACGGSEDDLERYFQSLASIGKQVPQNEEFRRQFEQDFEGPSGAKTVGATRDYITYLLPLQQDYLDELAMVNPPTKIGVRHNRFLEAFQSLVDAFGIAIIELDDANTRLDVLDIFVRIILPAYELANNACLELQQVARDEGLTVDLKCSFYSSPAFASRSPIGAPATADVAIQSFSHEPSTVA